MKKNIVSCGHIFCLYDLSLPKSLISDYFLECLRNPFINLAQELIFGAEKFILESVLIFPVLLTSISGTYSIFIKMIVYVSSLAIS